MNFSTKMADKLVQVIARGIDYSAEKIGNAAEKMKNGEKKTAQLSSRLSIKSGIEVAESLTSRLADLPDTLTVFENHIAPIIKGEKTRSQVISDIAKSQKIGYVDAKIYHDKKVSEVFTTVLDKAIADSPLDPSIKESIHKTITNGLVHLTDTHVQSLFPEANTLSVSALTNEVKTIKAVKEMKERIKKPFKELSDAEKEQREIDLEKLSNPNSRYNDYYRMEDKHLDKLQAELEHYNVGENDFVSFTTKPLPGKKTSFIITEDHVSDYLFDQFNKTEALSQVANEVNLKFHHKGSRGFMGIIGGNKNSADDLYSMLKDIGLHGTAQAVADIPDLVKWHVGLSERLRSQIDATKIAFDEFSKTEAFAPIKTVLLQEMKDLDPNTISLEHLKGVRLNEALQSFEKWIAGGNSTKIKNENLELVNTFIKRIKRGADDSSFKYLTEKIAPEHQKAFNDYLIKKTDPELQLTSAKGRLMNPKAYSEAVKDFSLEYMSKGTNVLANGEQILRDIFTGDAALRKQKVEAEIRKIKTLLLGIDVNLQGKVRHHVGKINDRQLVDAFEKLETQVKNTLNFYSGETGAATKLIQEAMGVGIAANLTSWHMVLGNITQPLNTGILMKGVDSRHFMKLWGKSLVSAISKKISPTNLLQYAKTKTKQDIYNIAPHYFKSFHTGAMVDSLLLEGVEGTARYKKTVNYILKPFQVSDITTRLAMSDVALDSFYDSMNKINKILTKNPDADLHVLFKNHFIKPGKLVGITRLERDRMMRAFLSGDFSKAGHIYHSAILDGTIFDYSVAGKPGLLKAVKNLHPLASASLVFTSWPMYFSRIIVNAIKENDHELLARLLVASAWWYGATKGLALATSSNPTLSGFFTYLQNRNQLTEMPSGALGFISGERGGYTTRILSPLYGAYATLVDKVLDTPQSEFMKNEHRSVVNKLGNGDDINDIIDALENSLGKHGVGAALEIFRTKKKR